MSLITSSAPIHRCKEFKRCESWGKGQIKVRRPHLRWAGARGQLVQGGGAHRGQQEHFPGQPGGSHQDRVQQHYQGERGKLQPCDQEQVGRGLGQVLRHRHRPPRGPRGPPADLHWGQHGHPLVEEDQGRWRRSPGTLSGIKTVLSFYREIVIHDIPQLEKIDSDKNSWCACGHTKDNTLSVPCLPGLQYRFRVTAVTRYIV